MAHKIMTSIKTTNEIKLTGENSVGIYTTGSGIQNIENSGLIEIGNSSDRNNLGMAIYNTGVGNTVLNTGINGASVKSFGMFENATMCAFPIKPAPTKPMFIFFMI